MGPRPDIIDREGVRNAMSKLKLTRRSATLLWKFPLLFSFQSLDAKESHQNEQLKMHVELLDPMHYALCNLGLISPPTKLVPPETLCIMKNSTVYASFSVTNT